MGIPELPRRHFLQGGTALAGLALLTGCGLVPSGWQPSRRRRIGFLAPDAVPTSRSQAFVAGLASLGWVDGQNVELVYRTAAGRPPGGAACQVPLHRQSEDGPGTRTDDPANGPGPGHGCHPVTRPGPPAIHATLFPYA